MVEVVFKNQAPGVGRPSASASISGPSVQQQEVLLHQVKKMMSEDMRFNAFTDAIQNKARSEGMNVTKTFFSNEDLQKCLKKEKNRENTKNKKSRLMQRARDKKENNERLSDIASEELDQFNIKLQSWRGSNM